MLARVKKNDTVLVLSGKDKGKQSIVLSVDTKKDMIVVKDVAVVTRHLKPKKAGEKGKIVKIETPIHACKVMPINPTTKKPSRVQVKVLEDGSKVRVCAKTKNPF